MEGFPGWAILAIFAAYALAGGSLSLASVAGVVRLAGRPEQARKLFAAAFLGLAIAAALMAIATQAGRAMDRRKSLSFVFAFGLFLAGIGPIVAAFRSPRAYAAAVGCSAASLAFAAGPLMFGHHLWLRWVLAAAFNLILGAASLMISALSRPWGGGDGGSARPAVRPRSRKRMLPILGLANLVAFVLAVVYLEPDHRVLLEDEFSNLVTNTYWRLVLAVLGVSAMISAALLVFGPSRSHSGPPPASDFSAR